MTGGCKLLLLSGALAATGCAASHQVQVRAIPYPGANSKTGGDLLAQARGQLALGDVGLALESFRAVQLEQPENPHVFEGIAQCYAAMSRYDLVRTNLEFALAYAPNDPRLLNELAVALDRLGEPDQAVEVRAEASRLISVPAPSATEQAGVTPMGVPRTGSVTVKLPAPMPLGETAAKLAAKAPPQSSADTPRDVAFPRAIFPKSSVNVAAAPSSMDHRQSLRNMDLPAITAFTEPAEPVPTEPSLPRPQVAIIPHLAAPSSRIEVGSTPAALAAEYALSNMHLPQVRPVIEETAPPKPRPIPMPPAAASKAPETDAQPIAPKHRTEIASGKPDLHDGPYLARTSRGEVALITNMPPVRMAELESKTVRIAAIAPSPPARRPEPLQPRPEQMAALATRVQWVPLKYASMPQNVELLNAARTQGLAARTRIALQDRGWRKIRIGNALRERQRSLVLYSASRTVLAHRLALQFRCASLKIAGLKNVVVLLGRDAALRRGPSARA